MEIVAIIFILIAVFIICLIVSSIGTAKAKKEKERLYKEKIYSKYGHTEIAEKIINKNVWVGETTEQLTDSLGSPIGIDENVLKTKRKETWKYYQKSTTRFGLKVKIENNVVVGWDEKL